MRVVDPTKGELGELGVHPAADVFPMMSHADYIELRDSIAANGQREPIVVDDAGLILDGRNRVKACDELGIEIDVYVYRGDDPVGLVMDLNLHRRHLSTSQRAMVAAKLANLGPGRPSETAANEAVSQEDAAEMLGVSRGSVQRAAQVENADQPELSRMVSEDEVTVSAAVKFTKLDKDVQEAALADGPEEVLKAVADAEPPTPTGPQGIVPTSGDVSVGDLVTIIPQPWVKDPSVLTEAHNEFARFMDRRTIRGADDKHEAMGMAEKCPPRLLAAAIANAQWNACRWNEIANELRRLDPDVNPDHKPNLKAVR